MKNSDIVIQKRTIVAENPDSTIKEAYSEITIGKTTYCITSVFSGEIDLRQTLERLAVSNVLSQIEAQRRHPDFQKNVGVKADNASEE